ncbi:MAG: ATP-dependent helicase, Ku domain [Betaproteobacteria bacterium]|nr:ATP-dependent helicase, Ku domain [Betaproteobacteria bacterium]
MPRVLWKGAISFGLVHVPVSLYPATRSEGLSFDMIDKRDFAPIGYKRYNKKTGEDIERENIVKGYEYEKGEYVVVTDEDFKQANVEATQTVDIVAFVEAAALAPYYYDTPYYLEPGKRGEKGYTLLREVLRRTGRVGIANVVIRSKQHLAALIPLERMLLMNTLRFAHEIRPASELNLPDEGLNGLSEKEVAMAERLVDDMTEKWDATKYKDTYTDDLMAQIEKKIKSGETHAITPASPHEAEPRRGAEVIDLVSLLRRSLEKKGKGAESAQAEAPAREQKRAAARKPASRLAKKASAQRKRA